MAKAPYTIQKALRSTKKVMAEDMAKAPNTMQTTSSSSIKASGRTTNIMAMAPSTLQTATSSTKASGRTTNIMAKAPATL